MENVIERAVTLEIADNIYPESIPDEIKSYAVELPKDISNIPSTGLNLENYISEIEKNIILNALNKTGWIKKKAAELLNMSFRSFRYKLQKYDIEKE